jgi:hypothetical protein
LKPNAPDERLPPAGGKSVSIRFDGSRWFRASHQDRPLIRGDGPREARAIIELTGEPLNGANDARRMPEKQDS